MLRRGLSAPIRRCYGGFLTPRANAGLRSLSALPWHTRDLLGAGDVYVAPYASRVPVQRVLDVTPKEDGVYEVRLFDPQALADVEAMLRRSGLRVVAEATRDDGLSLFVRRGQRSWKDKGKFRHQWEVTPGM